MNLEKRHSAASIGITSFVLIFVMLCLLTFSVLSLATARADLKLSQRSAERTLADYDAENRANDVLMNIISCLEDCLDAEDSGTESSGSSFYAQVREQLEGQDGISFDSERVLRYAVALEEEQLLCVSLELSHEPYGDGSHYRILEWRTESTHEWGTDESLPLLDADSLSDLLTEE